MLEWNGDKILAQFENATAQKLQLVGTRFRVVHDGKLSVANPWPYHDSSKPGEYPRTRTGAGRAALTQEPISIQGIKDAGMVTRIGFIATEPHLLYLELAKKIERRRKGLLDTLNEILAELRAIVTG